MIRSFQDAEPKLSLTARIHPRLVELARNRFGTLLATNWISSIPLRRWKSHVYRPAIALKHFPGIGPDTIASASTSSTESASSGANWGQCLSRLSIIIRGVHVKAMVRIPTHRAPTHPGEMLLEEFLMPMNMTQRELADAIQVPYQRINEIVNGKRGVTPSTALRLAKFFGMTPDFWMNVQLRWDLYWAQQEEQDVLARIEPRPTTSITSSG